MQSLETRRMRLRPLLKSDSANLMKIFSDPIAMEFYLGTKDEPEAREWIERSQNRYKDMGIGFLACELKKQGNFWEFAVFYFNLLSMDGMRSKWVTFLFENSGGRGLRQKRLMLA